ncbi:MAG TPA: hypothetical protein VMU83_03345 [Hanamia sp.]|nr:hypothetical protein [Hanamia sp.]
MKLFKRKEDQVNIADKAATGIANGILKSQRWFANILESLTNKWKQKQQWIFLYAVCLLFGGLSITAMVNSFKTGANSNTLMPKSITVPKNIYKGDQAFIITENEFQKVQEYKRTHPNLINERPGLFDSLVLIEQTYYSQKK